MRTRSLVVGAALGLLFISFTIYLTASLSVIQQPDDFAPSNTAWNGLSSFVSATRSTLLSTLSSLPPVGDGYTLMIIGPTAGFSPAEGFEVTSFVRSGGSIVLADDFGSGNTLLQSLGLNSRFTQELLTDPLFNFKNSWLVVAPRIEMKNVTAVALNYATTLSVTDSNARVLGWSSSFSYLYPNQPSQSLASRPTGPFPIVAHLPYGKGRVTLIADSSVFINSMIGRGSNTALLNSVISGRVLVDASHWSEGSATRARSFESTLYSYASVPEVKYSILLVGMAAILGSSFAEKREVRREDELSGVIEEHPEWNEKKLRVLDEELKRNE